MKKQAKSVPDMPNPPPPPALKRVFKATDLQASEVLKAFNKGLEIAAKYEGTLSRTCQPAGQVVVKGIRYAVVVELRKLEPEVGTAIKCLPAGQGEKEKEK